MLLVFFTGMNAGFIFPSSFVRVLYYFLSVSLDIGYY